MMAIPIVALVACAKRKRGGLQMAKYLYNSPLFRLAFEHARRQCDRVYILSAKHGLLDPNTKIRSYDVSLSTISPGERRAWAKRVARQLVRKEKGPAYFFFFCGSAYADELVWELRRRGISRQYVRTPLEGMGIGRQIQWHKKSLES